MMNVSSTEISATLTPQVQTGNKSLPLPSNYPTLIQKYLSCRWRLGYMISLAFMLTMILRNSMSFAIVCMTGEVKELKGDNYTNVKGVNTTSNDTLNLKIYTGEFQFDGETQGILISSAFYAIIIAPSVGSLCSSRLGPKRVVLIFLGVSGVLVFLTPLAARTHLYLLIAVRVVVGFTVSTVLPVAIEMYLYWAPSKEKPQLVMLSFAGYSVALILQYALSGLLCLVPIDNGWPFIFYFFGACTLLWCLIWHICIYNTPDLHPGISLSEKTYIMARRTPSVEKDTTIPWKSILTSRCVWAYIIVFSLHDWNNGIYFGYLPLYMATVLKFDVAQNGALSSLPYVSRLVATLVWTHVAESMTKCFSVTKTRKIMQVTGFLIAAGLSVSLCYVDEGQEYVAVAIFILSTPFQIVTISSGVVTTVDMAPRYASVLTSMGMTGSFLGMMAAPMAASYILGDRSRQQWTYLFYFIAATYAFAALVFFIFGSGELQPWAVQSENRTISSNENGQPNLAYIPDHDESTKL